MLYPLSYGSHSPLLHSFDRVQKWQQDGLMVQAYSSSALLLAGIGCIDTSRPMIQPKAKTRSASA